MAGETDAETDTHRRHSKARGIIELREQGRCMERDLSIYRLALGMMMMGGLEQADVGGPAA